MTCDDGKKDHGKSCLRIVTCVFGCCLPSMEIIPVKQHLGAERCHDLGPRCLWRYGVWADRAGGQRGGPSVFATYFLD